MTPYEQVVVRLGPEAFLVPCETGTKKPLVTYAQRSFAATQTAAYRAVFAATETNIAVYLGKASGGLCAIDFDRDEDLATFLAANPRPLREKKLFLSPETRATDMASTSIGRVVYCLPPN